MAAARGTLRISIAAVSDVGRSRVSNQDAAFAGALPGPHRWVLLAVADGLGGHAAGEWASARAIEVLRHSLPGMLETVAPEEALTAAFARANAAVYDEATETGHRRPATTLVAALVRDGEAWWANVGDSRIYQFVEGKLAQVSEDHSWVAEQVRAGLLTEKEASEHMRRSMVTRTIGFDPEVAVDRGGPLSLAEGDAVLLSSDGLHGLISDKEIAKVVVKRVPAEAVKALVARANAAGGPDNITVVIGRMVRSKR